MQSVQFVSVLLAQKAQAQSTGGTGATKTFGILVRPIELAIRNKEGRMILGFTGTRDGMTDKQKAGLMREILICHQHYELDEAHHGACKGADHQFHDLATWLLGTHRVILHMPTNLTMVPSVMFQVPDSQKMKPMGYLRRNEEIVKVCDRLVACPAQEKEIQRSGTWATVRYARKMGRKITLLTP